MFLLANEKVIGLVAAFCTVLQHFSAIFLCIDFIKQGSTKAVKITPFIGNAAMSILFLQNDILIQNYMLITVDIITIFLSLLFLILYIIYSKNKIKLLSKLGNVALFVIALIVYAQKEDRSVVQFRFSLVVTTFFIILTAAPLFSIKKILKTKNTKTLPMPLIISGTVVSLLWLFYAIIINEFIIKVQNSIALVINMIQFIVYIHCKLNRMKLEKKSE